MEMTGSVLAGLMAMLGLAADPALIVSARYDTDFGPLVLERHPVTGDVGGYYENYNGLITGHSNSTGAITAHWVQDQSDRACATERLGSLHWGRVEWSVQANGTLSGRWSYCDEALTAARAWNGTHRTGTLFPVR